MNSGIINVYKEAGYTSFDVVARLRGILKIKKIGHTGTLDPAAEGVLPVCIGKGTKLCDMLTDKDKIYECRLLLGKRTDTYDATGKVLETSEVNCTEDEVIEACSHFLGEIDQVPPMYSALKVNGKKLYEYARAGVEIERKARKIYIYSIEILSMELPEVSLRVHCSKGTYIRSLCHDIGETLGCGGIMKSLLRTKVSVFELQDSRKLDEIERIAKAGNIDSIILPVSEVFDSYKSLFVIPDEEAVKKAVNGAALPVNLLFSENVSSFEENERYRVFLPDNRFLGIYNFIDDNFVLEKMFLE